MIAELREGQTWMNGRYERCLQDTYTNSQGDRVFATTCVYRGRSHEKAAVTYLNEHQVLAWIDQTVASLVHDPKEAAPC